jgi:arginase
MHIAPRPVGIVHAKTDLGLKPTGVDRLGEVLLERGLAKRLAAQVHPGLQAPAFDTTRDPEWGVPNINAASQFAVLQADAVSAVAANGEFPLVLGGDDSILFGCLLAVRRQGPSGLMLLDAHTDYYDTRRGFGELSDSDLWIVNGNGPPQLANLEGMSPLVEPRNCVVYGHRDRPEQLANSSDDVYRTPMLVRSLAELRAIRMSDAAQHAVAFLAQQGQSSVWLHIDADCLDDALMPAVDYRDDGGLAPAEVIELLRPLIASGLPAGMSVSIYNPALDTADLDAGQVLVDLLVDLLT